MKISNEQYMDNLVRKSLKSIANSKSTIPQKKFTGSDYRDLSELKRITERVSSNGYLVLSGYMVSRVGYDSKNYLVVVEGGSSGINIMISFGKMQQTTTLVRDLVGCDMKGCPDLAYADIVAIVVKNDMKILPDNCVGFTGIDIYAYENPGYSGSYSFFAALNKDNKIMVVDKDIFEEHAEKNHIDDRSIQLEQSGKEFLSGSSASNDSESKNQESLADSLAEGIGKLIGWIFIILVLGHFLGC